MATSCSVVNNAETVKFSSILVVKQLHELDILVLTIWELSSLVGVCGQSLITASKSGYGSGSMFEEIVMFEGI